MAFLKYTLGFILFVMTDWIVGLIVFFIVYFVNRVLNHTDMWMAAPWSVAFGAGAGIYTAHQLLEHKFSGYPRRLFAGIFIGLTLVVFVMSIVSKFGDNESFNYKDFTSGGGMLISCFGCWWLMWRSPPVVASY